MTKTVERGYKCRFYPTPEQEDFLIQQWDCVRYVYNQGLELRKTSWENGETVNFAGTSAALTQWRADKDFLSSMPVVPQQQCLRNLDKAYTNFFEKRAKFPKFKSKRKSDLSLQYSRKGFSFKNGQLYLAKMKDHPVHLQDNRTFNRNAVSTVWVKRDAARRWFVSMLVTEEVQPKHASGACGVDLGVKTAVTLDDGQKIDPISDLAAKQVKVRKRQKELSKKVRGSANYGKARIKLARAYAELTDARRDFLHKVTSWLVENYGIICIEDLNVKGMTASAKGTVENPGVNVRTKAGLNRAILNHSFGEFRRMLTYKGDWYGREIVVVDRFFPSSKTCSSCGAVTELTLNDRTWTCGCGATHDRDVNAAINIRTAGLAAYACGGDVNPGFQVVAVESGRS